MNSQDLAGYIESRRPKCPEKYRGLMDTIGNQGDKTGKGGICTLGAYGQTFMYAFIIGHKIRNGKLNDSDFKSKEEKTFDITDFGNWKPAPIRDYITMILLNESEEMGVSCSDLDDASEDAVKTFVQEMMRRMEAYANVGLEYLNDKWTNEKYEFEDPFVFVNFLQELS